MGSTDPGDTSTAEVISRAGDTTAAVVVGQATNGAPREALISTAITFLQNNNVRRSPLNQKQQFLRSKGLNEDEIQIACERAGVFTADPNSTVINMDIGSTAAASKPIGRYQAVQQQMTTFQWIKDMAGTAAFIAGIAYGIYLFYKKYIEPFLFGRKKKDKTASEKLDDLNRDVMKNIVELTNEMQKVRTEIETKSRNDPVLKEFHCVKSDLDAIKGLLLNRKQFSSPVVPPSIPVWQLQSQHRQVDEQETDKIDDAGSGSGSSETEVVTKNSDSSLELIS